MLAYHRWISEEDRMPEEKSKDEIGEENWVRGNRAAWVKLLRLCLNELGTDSPEWTANRWQVHHAETVAMLRRVCEHHGDNDWPDDLYLPDVIEKHLWNHLEQ